MPGGRPPLARRRGPHATRPARQAPAFEVIYERHSQAAFSLAYRMVRLARRRRGRRAGGVPVALALGARYERTRGSVRTWVLGIVHHRAIDALRRSSVHEKRRASDEGLEERSRPASARTSRPPATRRPPTVRAALDSCRPSSAR